MADLWYYTKNGKQQEPVTGGELRRLAASKVLLSTDLVWRDGMAEWVEARSLRGLFPASGASASQAATRDTEKKGESLYRRERHREEDEVRPRRSQPADEADEIPDEQPRRRRRADDNEEDDLDDAAPRRRRRERHDDDDDDFVRPRRRSRRRAGMSTGAKVAMILGGVALVLVLIVVVIILAVSGSSGTRSFSLAQGTREVYQIRFQGGKKVEMWVESTGSSDVDLYVFDEAGREVRFDDGDSSDCYLWFLAAKTQTYRVEVRNMSRIDRPARNGHNSGTLKFLESDGEGLAPPPPQVHQGRIVPGGGPAPRGAPFGRRRR